MHYGDFIEISPQGTPLPPYERILPSAETAIHCAIYKMFPDTQVILHSHEVNAVVKTIGLSEIVFEGYELQKAFRGVTTHEGKISIPVIPNSQDMNVINASLLERKEELTYGVFMIEKHGYYTWGNSIFEAKRYLEAFAYLCRAECLLIP
jgi:methylthioribulose-1-phosphate dehydratase